MFRVTGPSANARVRWMLGAVWVSLFGAGCSSRPGALARELNTTPPSERVACPKLATPPAGQCRTNDDCKADYVECAWGSPKAGPRVTGSGTLFGTDGMQCRHGYRQVTPCPDGQAFRTQPAANLCPQPECVPRCSDSACAAEEICDQGTGLCRPIPCRHGWACAADEICKHGPNADKHGCAPRCPGYGTCVIYGPPIP